MKVLFITPSLLPTGPVRVFLTLAKFLRKVDVMVSFWYFDDLPGAVEEDSEKVSFWGKADFSDYDIVQSVGLRPDLYVHRNIKRNHVPTVTTMENYVEEDFHYEYGPLKARLFVPIWKYAVRRHSRVVVLQPHMQDYYRQHWGLKETMIIGNCSEFDKAQQDRETMSRFMTFKGYGPLLGSVGSINNRKGLQQIARLLAIKPSLKWLHLGDGKDRPELEQLINDLGVGDRIMLPGNTPHASAYIALFDVFLMPSYSEGMPLAMLEAVMQKLPCISTDLPVFKSIFNAEETGQFKPDDIDDFCRVFDAVMSNTAWYAERSHKRYLSEYAPEVIAGKYKSLYESLISN